MATGAKKQDMPPQGGYRAIPFLRNPAKTYFSGPALIAGFCGASALGFFLYAKAYKKITQERVEMRSAFIALTPMLLAEQDRAYLRQLRLNRDEEARLMANVPGWEVGTYYGETLYKTMPEDYLPHVPLREYYAHTSNGDYTNRANHFAWL